MTALTSAAGPRSGVTGKNAGRWLATLGACAALLAAPSATAGELDLGRPGPFAPTVKTLGAVDLSARPSKDQPQRVTRTDLYCPEHGRRSPEVVARQLVVVLADDGWQPEHVAGTAQHLASHGFVVAVPRLPAGTPAAQAGSVQNLMRALDERSGVVKQAPLVDCLAQQEIASTVLLAHGRAARLVLEIETRYERNLGELPRKIWLDPNLDEVELSLRTPATQPIPGAYDPYAEHPPGMSPAELMLVPDDDRCPGNTEEFFERTRVSRSRLALRVDEGSRCSMLDPGSPTCAAECGPGTSRARATARSAITAWLQAQGEDRHAPAPQLALALADLPGLSEIEQRPLESADLPIQFSASLLLGVGAGLRGEGIPDAGFAVGGRPALVYGRATDGYVGIAGYGEVVTAGLSDVQVGGGLELILPLYYGFVLAPSVGALGWLREDRGWEPALTGGGFIGFRGGSAGSALDPAFGFRVDGRFGVGDRADRALLVTFQGDVISPLVALATAIAWAL